MVPQPDLSNNINEALVSLLLGDAWEELLVQQNKIRAGVGNRGDSALDQRTKLILTSLRERVIGPDLPDHQVRLQRSKLTNEARESFRRCLPTDSRSTTLTSTPETNCFSSCSRRAGYALPEEEVPTPEVDDDPIASTIRSPFRTRSAVRIRSPGVSDRRNAAHSGGKGFIGCSAEAGPKNKSKAQAMRAAMDRELWGCPMDSAHATHSERTMTMI